MEHDDLAVVRTAKTAGAVFSQGGGRITLHNAEAACHNVERIKDKVELPLGDVPYRPDLKRLCGECEWPDGAEAAYERSPRRFRR